MSDKELKVMIVGAAGEMGRAAARFMTERGATVVAAIGRTRHLGEDIGELAGVGALGVAIEPADAVESALERARPDVVLDASGELDNVAENVKTCLRAGANVAMLAEAAYFPHATHRALADEINAVAKENGVTAIGLGMQDVNWSNQAVVMAANCHKLNRIEGENWCILDHCGNFEIGLVGVNLDEDEFYEYHKNDLNPRNPFTYALYEIADEMGLHVISETNSRIEPLFAQEDYDATECAYGKVIEKGKTIGALLTTTLETEEGITIAAKFYYSFAENDQPGENVWRFDGEPSFEVVTDDPRPDIGTTTDVVNRLPDIVNAKPGFLTVKDLPKPIYRCHSLPEYLD